MSYLLTVVLVAVRFSLKPAILAAGLGVLAYDYFFVEPRISFVVADWESLFTFFGLFTVSVVISTLVSKGRERIEVLRNRELQTESLYYLSRDLAAAADRPSILAAALKHVGETLQAELAVLMPHGDAMEVVSHSRGLLLEANDLAVAEWTFRNRRQAGFGTETHETSALLFLPLHTSSTALGVLAIRLTRNPSPLSSHDRHLIDAFAAQISLALERVQLAERAEQAQVLQARESLERALLNSISHDLRTPLVSIIGAMSSLREQEAHLSEANRRDLLTGAWDEAQRLNRFVGNLLDMTRLEAGELRLRREPCDIQDLIGCALSAVDQKLENRAVGVHLADDLPLVEMDMVLMTQVLVNLLDNAVKYSPPDSPIELRAHTDAHVLTLEVLDRGPGIPRSDLQRVFEKFYRLPVPEGVGGTGLGLSICKGIVEAHLGTIRADNRDTGGLRIICRLPLSLHLP